MHNAPSVAYPVGRCAFQRQVWWSLVLITCTVLCAWALKQPVGWNWLLGFLTSCGGLWWGWLEGRMPPAHLCWDGQTWSLRKLDATPVDEPGQLRVAMDVQHTLLLTWQPLSSPCMTLRWLWLGREQAPQHWQDLRRAVYSGTHLH